MSPRDNERLEYLGDAVLQLITADYLFRNRPDAQEGEMTQVRSAMVNTNTLAALSEELNIGDYLYLGRGIAKGGGRNLRSLLANAFEAVLGAVFLDAGFDAAYHYYLDRFRALPVQLENENYKGRLQQVVQELFGQTPYYDAAGARGTRLREYTAVVYAGPEALGTGHGASKQEAEQQAAKDALLKIEARSAAPVARRRTRSQSIAAAGLPEPPEGESVEIGIAAEVASAIVSQEQPLAPRAPRRRSPRPAAGLIEPIPASEPGREGETAALPAPTASPAGAESGSVDADLATDPKPAALPAPTGPRRWGHSAESAPAASPLSARTALPAAALAPPAPPAPASTAWGDVPAPLPPPPGQSQWGLPAPLVISAPTPRASDPDPSAPVAPARPRRRRPPQPKVDVDSD